MKVLADIIFAIQLKSNMQIVELAGVTLTLLIKVWVGVIFTYPLKVTSGEKTARPGSHKFVAAGAKKNLYCLVRPIYLAVLAPISEANGCRY